MRAFALRGQFGLFWRRCAGKARAEAHDQVLSLLGAFSDAALTVEHFYALGDEASGYRTMTRWNLQGTHKGAGPYGDPTGQPFYLLGISHHTLQDGRFVEEWTYFDEVALLAQLCRQAG